MSNELTGVVYRCRGACWCWRILRCPSSSCSRGTECVDVSLHLGTSWPDQSLLCTQGCPFYPAPWGSCLALCLDGLSSWNECTPHDLSTTTFNEAEHIMNYDTIKQLHGAHKATSQLRRGPTHITTPSSIMNAQGNILKVQLIYLHYVHCLCLLITNQ